MRVIVTGASQGIGLALSRNLVDRGDEVIAACLEVSDEISASGARVVAPVDVSVDDGLDPLRRAVGTDPVDVVICNAGVCESFEDGIAHVDVSVVVHEIQVNAVGALRTVQAVRPNLRSGSKIALMSSGIVAPGLPGRATPGQYGYKMSKAALNELGVSLANELRPEGISVLILNPGPTDTRLLRRVFAAGETEYDPSSAGRPQDVAADLLARIDALDHERSGRWLSRDGTELGL